VFGVVLITGVVLGAGTAAAAGARSSKPGVALTRRGTGDCARILQPGWEIAFAVEVSGGHTICVTHEGEQSAYYLDGRMAGRAYGADLRTFFGGLGRVDGREVVFGNLPSSASTMRLTFCKGQTLVLRPLNRDLRSTSARSSTLRGTATSSNNRPMRRAVRSTRRTRGRWHACAILPARPGRGSWIQDLGRGCRSESWWGVVARLVVGRGPTQISAWCPQTGHDCVEGTDRVAMGVDPTGPCVGHRYV
jgi:hypothetical protein